MASRKQFPLWVFFVVGLVLIFLFSGGLNKEGSQLSDSNMVKTGDDCTLEDALVPVFATTGKPLWSIEKHNQAVDSCLSLDKELVYMWHPNTATLSENYEKYPYLCTPQCV